MDRPVPPVLPAPTETQEEATRRVPMRSIFPSLSRRCREKNFAARNVYALHTPIVGETPEARALEDARLANLAEALDWRTSSEHSTSVRDNGFLNPVDVSSSRPRRYIEL